ncbi:molybdopterin cofactor-binding domain-containing protein [Variovorax sp. VNK109]|uniref:molybdopterin cofactor-binding domain-containing protein n=1 Tax=Variovorax sp. VNK109 TaxID=3400919 RepID=UPI003C03C40E
MSLTDTPTVQTYRHIGKAVAPQKEALAKVTGQAIYTHDFTLPDMLHGAILRSPHAHARIVSIDVSRASAMPGVQAVLLPLDAPDRYIHLGPRYADRFPLAHDVVRFVGEEVAAVAADTLAQALDAVAAIDVTYEVLPAVFDAAEALEPGAPVLHQREALPPNVAQHSHADWGGAAQGFAQSVHTVEGTYSHGIVAPVCMETNAVVASYDEAAQKLDVWAGTQAPFFVRKEMAGILGLPTRQVRVHAIEIGGGFGGKSQAPEPIGIAALLSRKAKRPVKIVLTRREEFISGKTDHAKRMTLSTGVDAQGNILARRSRYVVDNGAFTHMGPAYVSAVRQRSANLYRVGAVEFDGRLVYTNKVPGGSYRGMGVPQIIWALETQVDELAELLGKDPLDYRVGIANQPGDVTPQGFEISTCAMAECLQEAGRRIGWAEKRRNPRPWRGVGVAAMINPSVGILYAEGNFANVSLELREDGRFLLATQNADCGTWQNTTLAQFVSQTLDVDLTAIDVIHMDTEEAPDDLGSAASRVTFMTGAAAIDASNVLMAQVRSILSQRLGVEVDTIRFADDGVSAPGKMGWQEVAAITGPLKVNGHHKLDQPYPDPKTGYGNYSATYAFGAQAVEVEVDPDTGHVKVLKVVVVQDVGRVINEASLDGQMHGGVVQGIGMALAEDLVFDHGRPVNTSLINYRVPRIFEATEIETAYIETADPRGPLGAKSSGETSINPTVAAIANAVAHATGIRFRTLPLTPHKVLAEIRRKQKRTLALQPWRRPFNLEVAVARSLYPKGLFPAMKMLGAAVSQPRPRVSNPDYLKAASIEDAALLLATHQHRRAKLIAGGSDLLPGTRQGVYAPELLIDISRLAALQDIDIDAAQGIARIGAGVTLATLTEHDDLRRLLPGLVEAADLIATRQIRNVATVAGDLCQEKRCWFFRSGLPCYKNGGASCPCYAVMGDNRHHAIMGAGRCAAPCVADLAPALTALDATVIVHGQAGKRRIAMADFYRWSGETTVSPQELILSIEVPLATGSTQVYEKYAQWRGDFPEASAGVRLTWDGDRLASVRISLGGVSPLPMRATHAERALMTQAHRLMNDDSIRTCAQKVVYGALPLRDNAAKADMIVAVTERALRRARDARHAH